MVTLEDGVYEVNYKDICAGFVVESGRITECAPILRRRLSYWITIAKKTSR